MPFKFNPITGLIDYVDLSTTTANSKYLKLDQTIPQQVSNGSPEFNAGLTIKAGQPLYFDGN